jgi:hypothetical protein
MLFFDGFMHVSKYTKSLKKTNLIFLCACVRKRMGAFAGMMKNRLNLISQVYLFLSFLCRSVIPAFSTIHTLSDTLFMFLLRHSCAGGNPQK